MHLKGTVKWFVKYLEPFNVMSFLYSLCSHLSKSTPNLQLVSSVSCAASSPVRKLCLDWKHVALMFTLLAQELRVTGTNLSLRLMTGR